MILGRADTDRQVLIVAEIGNNHEGDMAAARELVRQAAAAGADAVKFQTFRTERFVSPADAARFRQLKGFELRPADVEELAGLARSLELLFLSTPLDLESAKLLEPLVDAFKIASGDNNFLPLLAQVAATGKPLVVSTGLSDTAQVAETVAFVQRQWAAAGLSGQLAILHCVSSYPVAPQQANLRSIEWLRERFPGLTVGYSDHTVGIEAPVLAVALGARILEKHFTLDRARPGFRDHQLSADPADLRELVRRVRLAEAMLGMRGKAVQPCEEPLLALLRRAIVAAADLPAGHRLTPADLLWLRPAAGLAPGNEARLVGGVLARNVRSGEPLQSGDVRSSS